MFGDTDIQLYSSNDRHIADITDNHLHMLELVDTTMLTLEVNE